MTSEENVIRETEKYSMNASIKQVWSQDGQSVLCREVQSSKRFRKLGKVFVYLTTVKFQIRDESLKDSVLLVRLYVVELYTHLCN